MKYRCGWVHCIGFSVLNPYDNTDYGRGIALLCPAMNKPVKGMTEKLTDNMGTSIAIMLAVSLVPSMMHAIVLAYIWTVTQSLAVVSVYHAAFDEIRDAIAPSLGFGPLVKIWQMLTLTILGLSLIHI